MRIPYKILVRKPEEKISLGRPRRKRGITLKLILENKARKYGLNLFGSSHSYGIVKVCASMVEVILVTNKSNMSLRSTKTHKHAFVTTIKRETVKSVAALYLLLVSDLYVIE
jgi:hypothetical protein